MADFSNFGHYLRPRTLEQLDGCYVLKTDLSATAASKELIHERYKDLALVEWAFRTSKTVQLAGLYGCAADLGEATSPTGYPQELFNIIFLASTKSTT